MGRSILAAVVGSTLLLCGCSFRPESVAVSLNKAEIARVASAVRDAGLAPESARFVSVARREPDKAAGAAPAGAAPAGAAPARAIAVVYDYASHTLHEHVVDVASGRIEQTIARRGAQPQVLEEELTIASDLARADPRWRSAVQKRGVTDFDQVLIDGWAPGERAPGGVPDGTRTLRLLSYDTSSLRDRINPYSAPIEGLEVLIDLDSRQVVQVIDRGVVSSAAPSRAPKAESPMEYRPLRASQPRGSSVRIDADRIAWGHWRLRVELHPRDGLILRDIGWTDADAARVRPILASAMLSEMVVPYGDPSASWRWRSAFDAGEYGLGSCAHTLTPGREVPDNATVLDGCGVTSAGQPWTIPAAIAIYERDAGLGWLHYDYLSERVESARARELWITNIFTIGNYDYGVHWIFGEDGSIRVEALLTGVLLPKASAAESCSACAAVVGGAGGEGAGDERYGTLIAPGLVAPNHQHWFCFRLDFDVDGTGNSVLEMNTRSAGPGPENPRGNAFVVSETLLQTERDAARDVSPADDRHWRIVNPAVRNGLGHFSGYELVPAGNGVVYAAADSQFLHDAGFVKHHFWVTRYDPAELHAAGDYPNQTRGGEGLSAWVGDESIVNGDIVAWYSLAVTHAARAEEWPVMPTERAGFRILPRGFFERNPAYRAAE
jgi:primary-amine oxidase